MRNERLLVLFLALIGTDVFAQQARSETDVIQLEATIRGNKEQPNVLSIVPWQLPQAKSIDVQSTQTLMLIDIQPFTRAEFKRELNAYEARKTNTLSPQKPRN